jgi:D-glycero-alpha-D-manno-heptose-7-phosphate kinase
VEHGGFVCNVAITRYATATIREGGSGSDDAPLVVAALRRAEITGASLSLHCDYPVGAGLGGSSAAGVAVAGALARWRSERLTRDEIAERSCATERDDLGVAGGRQDHYSAAHGGALALTFAATHTSADPIPLDESLGAALRRRCLLYYTGESRLSAASITRVVDAFMKGDKGVLAALAGMKRCARAMTEALGAGELDALGKLVAEHWSLQRTLHPGISTTVIDAIEARAMDVGALGIKALGASGGGCVIAIAREGGVEPLREALDPLAQRLDYEIDRDGFTVLEDDRG